ncbi:hypothetical protein M413DRAFT_165682 [Hebeloma cylindrosporum]|uniref:C2H2-type domain-containing protein n=1 Tax=Hebeloma cylindrosporum TaxID=76867 RepID=A0A0C2YHY1_HEBCY|nr:hypothetical protein M413DRAFT_165682 [Hebeloma cylindrosporum h7]
MEDILLTTTVAQRLGNSKRYGVYLPSRASLYEKDISFDSGNVWEYLTPGFTVDSEGSSTSSVESSESTPAQQIAIRYRAAHSFDLSASRSSSDSSQDSEPDSWEQSSQNDMDETDDTHSLPSDLKAVYRQSRHQALRDTFQEAMDLTSSLGIGPDDKVLCHRPGCRDTIANSKALAYHLHIHDIHDRLAVCSRCREKFEDATALQAHNCSSRGRFGAASPLRGLFGFLYVSLDRLRMRPL